MTHVDTTTNDSDRTFECDYNFGANIDESVELFGHDVVHNVFVANGVIKLQAFIRSMLNAEERVSDADMQAKVETWTLKAREKQDKVAKATKAMNKLSDDERKVLIAQYNEELNAS